jgi:hypothetical protein
MTFCEVININPAMRPSAGCAAYPAVNQLYTPLQETRFSPVPDFLSVLSKLSGKNIAFLATALNLRFPLSSALKL